MMTSHNYNGIQGRTFCFTGGLECFTRDEMEKKVTDWGGTAVRNISRKVNVLVVARNIHRRRGEPEKTYKQTRAEQLNEQGMGIEIMTEYDFGELVRKAEYYEDERQRGFVID